MPFCPHKKNRQLDKGRSFCFRPLVYSRVYFETKGPSPVCPLFACLPGLPGLLCCICPIARWVGFEPTSLCLEPNYYLLLKPHTGFIVFFIVFYPLNYHRLRPWLRHYAAPLVNRPVGTRTRDLLCVGQPFSPLNYRPICF